MYEVIAEYGAQALGWVLSGLGLLLARYVWARIGNELLRGVLQRTWLEVESAVKEVGQTYADALRHARSDGQLTKMEREIAKQQAIDIVKTNLGTKGLKRLARILDLDSVEDWLSNKIEASVADEKKLKGSKGGDGPFVPAA